MNSRFLETRLGHGTSFQLTAAHLPPACRLSHAHRLRSHILGLSLLLLGAACGPSPSPLPVAEAPTAVASPSGSVTSRLWVSPAVPDTLRELADASGVLIASSPVDANVELTLDPLTTAGGSDWIYVLVAPFPTVLDGLTHEELRAAWDGKSVMPVAAWPMWMTRSTLELFSELWGQPALQVHIADSSELLEAAWRDTPSWGIIPFEMLEPRWKVLAIDGNSPIRKDFAVETYPLQAKFAFLGDGLESLPIGLPFTNRDGAKLTTVLMSGTSALVREIAYQMEKKGITYPARDIGDWLRQADIFHVSHETSFDPTCPPPNPLKPRFFCSSPKYIGLFDEAGVDVVELTGNHILDNGVASMLYTLDLYRQHGIAYYGGGANLSEAQQPLLREDHGNRIAFVGCNLAEPPQPLATNTMPGANPCDWRLLASQLEELLQQGYLPIVTIQYKEGYSPQVMPWQSVDFRRVAEAGAIIVSGSQSHVPLQMEFHRGAFIHYGLGNLFFGQMANQPPGPGLPLQPAARYEFLDRHVIYDGRYVSTELLTAMLEDYARPRPMTLNERTSLLQAYFAYSGWLPFVPTPAPEKTPTLYPLLKFTPLATYTPLPQATLSP